MAGQDDDSGDEAVVFWAFVDAIAAVIDGAVGKPIFGSISTGVQGLITANSNENGGLLANPCFVANGKEDPPSPITRDYMKGRKWKSVGSAAVAIVGAGVSVVSQVDVGGILQHGNATGSTLMHLYKLAALAKNYRQSRTISDWIALVVSLKQSKAAVRGTQLASASIPIPAVGAVAGVLTTGAKLGIKLSMSKVCLATSAEIHWRAFQEQFFAQQFGGGQGKGKGKGKEPSGAVGPASRIVHEIFRRRGATRVFGQYDVDAIIQEPCGWMALNDKIMLI